MKPLRNVAVCATALAPCFLLACSTSGPCSSSVVHQLAQLSRPYAGRWTVAHGDTLTIPDPSLGDHFKLTDIVLDTDTVSIGRQCLYRGSIVFSVPKAETLAVTWFGVPEHATVFGWPAGLGPLAGVNPSWWCRAWLQGTLTDN